LTGRLRITGGQLARLQFAVPAAADKGLLRPTTDRLRESLFSSLGDLEGCDVLDVCAGSGALAFEALSRGAKHAVCIEHDAATMKTLRLNAQQLGLDARMAFVTRDAVRALAEQSAADLVLCDPPYDLELTGAWCDALAACVRPGARLVLERRKDAAVPSKLREALGAPVLRTSGDTVFMIFTRPSTAESLMASKRNSAAIYPGSFDPMTNGHVDIVQRGLQMFDRLIVAVANNQQKNHLFSIDERLALIQQSLGHLPGLEVAAFDGLVVNFARERGVQVLLRGLRAVSDFEYEFQLAGMNRRLAPEVETAFIVTSEDAFYVASRLVREAASYGGDVSSMVPAPVLAALKQKLPKR
jgi:pantetheine-phosphate adenylyltransferase